MENKKYLFCDLDGTLLVRSDKTVKIDHENLIMLEKWMAQGNELILVSGRHIADMKALIAEYNLNVLALSATNGALTIDNLGSVIEIQAIDKTIALKIIDYVLSKDYYIDFSNGQERFLKTIYKHSGDGKSNNLAGVNKIDDFRQAVIDNDILEINFAPTFTNALTIDEKIIISEQYIQFLTDEIGNTINHFISYNTPGYVSVVDSKVNKVVSIRKLIEHYNINIDNCYAIGDGQNDLEMLKWIPNSARMAACHDSLIKANFPAYESVAKYIEKVI